MKYIATQNTEWNIDATYRILKCKKGIFIIATRDLNKKAFPLLFFIVPRESAECIAHVLQEYKKWVQYEPYCFINDCQKAIINSVKSTFSCEDFLCVFHIIRAVRHQINNKALTQEIKDYSITKIQNLCMNIKDKNETKQLIEEIKNKLIDKGEHELLTYFQKNWFKDNCYESWCASYKNEHSKTNNISESLNHKIKQDYGLNSSLLRIDEFCELIVDTICPDFEFNASLGNKNMKLFLSQKIEKPLKERSEEEVEMNSSIRKLQKIAKESEDFPYKKVTEKLNSLIKKL